MKYCGKFLISNEFPWFLFLMFLFVFSSGTHIIAQTSQEKVIGVDEHLGAVVDLDAVFRSEYGDTVRLRDLVDRPTILSFVYFQCPGICTPLTGGLLEVVDRIEMTPGIDFKVITISINKDETPDLALTKKQRFLKGLNRPILDGDWWWLTGDSANIARITNSVGFGFKRTGDDFAHPATLIVLSPNGKIARYLYGITFNPFDLKLALLEASQERFGPSIATVLQFCFSYDPTGRKYVFNFLKIAATLTLVFVVGFVFTISLRKNKKRNRVK